MRKTSFILALLLSLSLLTPSLPSVSAQTVGRSANGGVQFLVGQYGRLLASGRSVTDTAVQNTWNVTSQAVAANTLNINGRTLQYNAGWLGANNVNTHEYQVYWSASSATCGGTGAALCDTGCIVLPSITNTTAFAGQVITVTIIRTASGTQDYVRQLNGGPTIAQTTGTCSITDTAAGKLVFGTRNTSAAAASLAQISYWVLVY